jgi:type IV secretory pathway TrbL component
MGFFATIKRRWKSKTPKFFNSLKKLAVALGSSATAVWVTNSSLNLEIDETILNVCKYLITFSTATGLTAQLTNEDSKEEDEVTN